MENQITHPEDLEFGLFSRYQSLANAINLFRDRTKPLKILEVGGRGNFLPLFLPADIITVLDIYPSDEPNYVQGDGRALPFADETFDLVVSTDTLEHIVSADRTRFVDEQIRVAKMGALIAAPFFTEEIAQIERVAEGLYRHITGAPHPWLEEHIAYGLPDDKIIDAHLRKNKIKFVKRYNQCTPLWSQLICLDLLVSSHYTDRVARLYKDFNTFYNQKIFPYDNGYPGYRTLYILAKDLKINLEQSVTTPTLSEIDRTLLQDLYARAFRLLIEIYQETQTILSDKDRHIRNIETRLKKEERQLKKEERQLKKEEKQLVDLNDYITDLRLKALGQEERIVTYEKHLATLSRSRLWQLFQLVVKLSDALVIWPATKFQHLTRVTRTGVRILYSKGLVGLLAEMNNYSARRRNGQEFPPIPNIDEEYQEWRARHKLTENQENQWRAEIKTFKHRPLISIVTPLYKTPPKILNETINSVINQIYPRWELCLIDDGSNDKQLVEYLRTLSDKRIKVKLLTKNKGIVGATNQAIAMAKGEYVAFLDHDDTLSADALFQAVKMINADLTIDMLYSDEDKISPEGKYIEPYFKPDWSPYLLLSQMYPTHLRIYRKSLGDKLGWMRKGFDGSQDYEFTLRFTERTNAVKRIPYVLYHWRQAKGSTALHSLAKSYTNKASLSALNTCLKRRGIKGEVVAGIQPETFRVKMAIIGSPLVSIIIPTRDQVRFLSRCIESILSKTDYDQFEIIILDNQSVEPTTHSYLTEISKHPKVKVLLYDKPFNFSAINNFGVKHAKGKYVLLLNNDTEVITNDWLRCMLELGQRPDVGAVGAKLLYPNNMIQHAGIVLGIGGIAGHSHKYIPDSFPGYFSLKDVIREYAAVTAGCLLISRKKYLEIGGLDESFAVAFNDVDFCLKLLKKGYKNVYTPFAKLYHHESISVGRINESKRDPKLLQKEVARIERRWGQVLKNDPYYNPNLTKTAESFGLDLS